MNFSTYIKDALWNLISNKMRSFLSVLWIVIWLFSVIFLMSFGTWAQQWVKDQMASLITNNITIIPKPFFLLPSFVLLKTIYYLLVLKI